MPIDRRQLMALLVSGLTGFVSVRVDEDRRHHAKRGKSMPIEFPPFELQASTLALQQLESGISGWRVERTGNFATNVWLRTFDGAICLLGVDQRDVRPMFEVFTLEMLSMSELSERWERWEPPALADDVPENFRQLLTTRPAAPVAPTDFDPWPLRSWRTDVVRRAEFVIEGEDVGPTIGNNPNAQSAARPKAVPPNASASCEVAAGILFTGEKSRLLLAVDWMPMDMLVSQDPVEIDAFLTGCDRVGLADYLVRARG